jgi:hypothetical protein
MSTWFLQSFNGVKCQFIIMYKYIFNLYDNNTISSTCSSNGKSSTYIRMINETIGYLGPFRMSVLLFQFLLLMKTDFNDIALSLLP